MYLKCKKDNLTKKEFNIKFHKFVKENNDLILQHPEYVFIHGTFEIFALSKAVKDASWDVKGIRGFVPPKSPKYLEKIINEIDNDIQKRLLKFVRNDKLKKLLKRGTTNKIISDELRKRIYPQLFLSIFANLEVYLETRAIYSMFNIDALKHLLIATPRNKMPEIEPYDWVFDANKVRERFSRELFRFPYHDFEGRVRQRYKYIFGVDIKKFKRWKELIRMREYRHTITHKGTVYLGVRLLDLSYIDVRRMAKLAMEFVEFIEKAIPSNMKGVNMLQHYDEKKE